MSDKTHNKNAGRMTNSIETNPVSRRTVLKTASTLGVGVAGITSLPTADAQSSQNNTTDESGVTKAVAKLLENGKVQQARKLLENYEVDFDHDRASYAVPSTDTGSNAGTDTGFTTSDRESDTGHGEGVWDTINFDLIGYNARGSEYDVSYHWELFSNDGCVCLWYPPPTDGVGLTWVDEFEYQRETLTSGPDVSEATVHRPGILARYDDYSYETDNWGWVSAHIEKQEPGQHDVIGNYTHTWSDYGVQGSVGFGISVGALTVTYTTATARTHDFPSQVIEI